MAGIGLTPRRPMVAEDIRDLQRGTGHDASAVMPAAWASGGQRRETIERAHDRADRVGGDVRVERGRIELGMAEQNLDQTRTSVFCSSRWVAKLCRKVCGVTRFLISAMAAAA